MAEGAVWPYGLGIGVIILIAVVTVALRQKKNATLILTFNLLPKL